MNIRLAGQYSTAPYTVYGARICVPGAIYGLAFVTSSSYWGPKLGVSYDGGISWNFAPGNPSGSISPTEISLQVPMSNISSRPWEVDFISGVWWYFNSYEIRDTTSGFTVPPYLTPYNVSARQRTDGSHLVDIYYDLWSPTARTVSVSIAVSDNGGSTYNITPSHISGQVGSGVYTGPRRHIIWDAAADLPGAVGTNYKLRVTATY